MIARLSARFRLWQRQPAIAQPGQGRSYGRWVIGLLTAVLLLWLIYRYLYQPGWLLYLPVVVLEGVGLAEAASAFTLAFLWIALWAWNRRKQWQISLPLLTVDELYNLSPGDFEQYVGQLFRQKGYRVRLRGGSGDLGVDVELHKQDGKKAVVQCKRYRTTVGSETVRELYGTLIHERAAHAFLVTTADISEAAREWARTKPITLIDGQTLVQIAAVLAMKTEPGAGK